MTHGNRFSRKIATIITVLLVTALLLTGTFAWQSISQQAVNQAIGKAAPAGGRLHDDFQVMGDNYGESNWRKDVSANKDVYVENFENQEGRDIFVRLKLYEYMESGPGAGLHPTDSGFATRSVESLIPGAKREDVSTWSPRLPGDDANSNLFREHWNWGMGGQKEYMPTFNKDPFSKESDVKGDAIDPQMMTGSEVPNTTKRKPTTGSNAYPAEAGLHDYFEQNQTHEATVKYWDWTLNSGDGDHAITLEKATHTARETLFATIVGMADWDGTSGNYWVVDDDGWFYWAAPLAPETATGLLLNEITLIKVPTQDWYYGIYIDAQMATADEIHPAFYGDPAEVPSFEAKDLLNVITNTTAPAIMRYVAGTAFPETLFMETNVRNDAVISFEVLDLNLNRIRSEAALIDAYNSTGGFREAQLLGAKDLTHTDSESKVFLFWDEDYNFYLAGNGGVHATGSILRMFQSTSNMISAKVALLDTSQVTDMQNVFLGASSLTTLDLSGWDTSQVINMRYMFSGTRSLTILNLSGWDTGCLTDTSYMFMNTNALTTIDFRNATFDKVIKSDSMFEDSRVKTIMVGNQAAADFLAPLVPIADIVISN